jgi:HEAT repeat protein
MHMAEDIVAELMRQLTSPDQKTRDAAVASVTSLGKRSRGAILVRLHAFTHPDEGVRRVAHRAMIHMGSRVTVPVLTKLLHRHSKDYALAHTAAIALRDVCRRADSHLFSVIPAIVSAVGDEDGFVRDAATEALAAAARGCRAAANALAAIMSRDLPVVSFTAALALAENGKGTDEVVPFLRRYLGRGALEEQLELSPGAEGVWADSWEAAKALSRVGRRAVAAIPELTFSALYHPSSFVRDSATDALAEIGAGVEAAIPELVQVLSDPEPSRRAQAANILGKIGVRAIAAAPLLLANLDDERDWIVRGAAEALVKMGAADAALDRLLSALKDGDLPRRRNAAVALGTLGRGARDEEVIRGRVEMYQSHKSYWQSEAEAEVEALATYAHWFGYDRAAIADVALPALLSALVDRSSRVSKEVRAAIAEIHGK